MSGGDNKEAALAIIRGIIGAATDVAKMAQEIEQEVDEIGNAPAAAMTAVKPPVIFDAPPSCSAARGQGKFPGRSLEPTSQSQAEQEIASAGRPLPSA